MLNQIIILCLITLIPLLELRLAIPVGILSGTINLPYNISMSGLGLNPLLVFSVVIITNILLGILIFHLLWIFDKKLKTTRFAEHYIRALERGQRKIKPYIDKYGILGLAIFISIPFPGSGVYTGSLGAFVIGMKKKDFYIANIIGVIVSGIIVTLLTLFGKSFF